MGDFIQVNISNSLNDSVCFEKKFPKDMNIGVLKVQMIIYQTVGGIGQHRHTTCVY